MERVGSLWMISRTLSSALTDARTAESRVVKAMHFISWLKSEVNVGVDAGILWLCCYGRLLVVTALSLSLCQS